MATSKAAIIKEATALLPGIPQVVTTKEATREAITTPTNRDTRAMETTKEGIKTRKMMMLPVAVRVSELLAVLVAFCPSASTDSSICFNNFTISLGLILPGFRFAENEP